MTEELKPARSAIPTAWSCGERCPATVAGGGSAEAIPAAGFTRGRPQQKLNGEFIQHSSGARVPREFYDLSPDAQAIPGIAGAEAGGGCSRKPVRSSRCGCSMRWTSSGSGEGLESSLLALMGVIEQQKQRLEAIDTTSRWRRAQPGGQRTAADAVVNAAAVEASLRNQTTQSQSELERQRDDHRARMEATERVLSDH